MDLFSRSWKNKSPLIATQQSNQEPNWKEDAYLANAAYRRAPVEGYDIDPALSNEQATTYKHHGSKKVTVAFAGTNFNPKGSILKKAARGASDLIADSHIISATEEDSTQFKLAENLIEKAIKKYGKENVYATGHSLGGTKSMYVSHKKGIHSTAFNPGWSPLDIAKHSTSALGKKWNFNKTKAYIVPGDPIAASALLQPGLKTQTIRQEKKLEDFKSNFKSKGYEMAAGKGMGEILAGIHPVVAGAYGAYGAYRVGKSAYALHSSDNFLGGKPSRSKSIPAQKTSNTLNFSNSSELPPPHITRRKSEESVVRPRNMEGAIKGDFGKVEVKVHGHEAHPMYPHTFPNYSYVGGAGALPTYHSKYGLHTRARKHRQRPTRSRKGYQHTSQTVSSS